MPPLQGDKLKTRLDSDEPVHGRNECKRAGLPFEWVALREKFHD